MFKSILLTVLLFLIAESVKIGPLEFDPKLPIDDLWKTYLSEFHLDYPMEELAYRFTVFQSNVEKIRKNPQLGITQFADWTEQEFQTKMLTLKPPASVNANSKPPDRLRNPFLDFVNWFMSLFFNFSQTCRPNTCPVLKGFDKNKIFHEESNDLTPVLNQGKCGSCYAFASMSALQDTFAHHYNQKIEGQMAIQQIVDCSKPQGNYGCDGGLMTQVAKYIKSENGMNFEKDYGPYTASEGECKPKKDKYTLKNFGEYIELPCDENKYKELVDQNVTIVLAVDATKWQHYKKGILSGDDCCLKNLNHAVVLSGYGVEDGVSYWLIKNSWATSWGEEGYVRLKQGTNCCGMLHMGGIFTMKKSEESTESPKTTETTESPRTTEAVVAT